MTRVRLDYWAAARAAAGRDSELFEADSVGAALRAAREARADPRFDQVLSASSLMLDGRVLAAGELDRPLSVAEVRIDVLPPFAGG